MKKTVKIIRMVSFVATLLSTIPLFINYLKDTEPKNEFIVHAHVWFGLIFFVFAIISMIMEKKLKSDK